jgi:ABC-type antimicrobial peptide transport system permease subunit
LSTLAAIGAAFADARRGLALRRRRALLTATGIGLAAAMLAAAVVVGDGLGRGFDRAANAADLPDVIVRFDPESARLVARRITELPDLGGYSLRLELDNIGVASGGHGRNDAVAEVVGSGRRRGYAVVAGRDLRPAGSEVLLERAFAQAWGVRLGSRFYIAGLGPETVVGFAEAPDNVGFPLAKPRFYVSRQAIDARFGREPDPRVNLAEVWLRDPRYLNEVLVQARSTGLGLHDIQFATRSGIRVLLDQAAGIVIDLLVALSLIALVTAGVMLGASARAEVQRRLAGIGVRRAVGAPRGHIALTHGFEALLVAAPAATIGLVAGVLATYGPEGRLLTLLNEPAPGAALALPLLAAWLISVVIPVAATAWPAWRAAGGPVVRLLRGGDISASFTGGRRSLRGGGLGLLGARLVAARRVRMVATAVTLGLSAAFVLLLLSLASALSALETDPGAVGKRYQLTASLAPSLAPRVRAIPGVQAAAPRYEVEAADSFSLGETIDVIAYPGDHTIFEAPPLVAGHRLRGSREAEAGAGLADALGLAPGSTLAVALPSGVELRLRVAGIVSSLDHDGRVAYIPAAALLAADPSAPSLIAIRTSPSADLSAVSAALRALGAAPAAASTATARGAPLVAVLRTILIAIAVVDSLVCLYALIQACALTVHERRRTVAVLRACGAGALAVQQLLLGAVIALVAPAAVIGVLLERLLLGPALANLAASYAALPLGASVDQVAAVLAGLAVAAGLAVVWVARQATGESVVAGLAA